MDNVERFFKASQWWGTVKAKRSTLPDGRDRLELYIPGNQKEGQSFSKSDMKELIEFLIKTEEEMV